MTLIGVVNLAIVKTKAIQLRFPAWECFMFVMTCVVS